MRQVILDTDVASLIIKQRLPAALLRELIGAQTVITFVTLVELTRWTTPTAERHVDRRLLPGLRPSSRNAQHQGLRRLRRARGSDTRRHVNLATMQSGEMGPTQPSFGHQTG